MAQKSFEWLIILVGIKKSSKGQLGLKLASYSWILFGFVSLIFFNDLIISLDHISNAVILFLDNYLDSHIFYFVNEYHHYLMIRVGFILIYVIIYLKMDEWMNWNKFGNSNNIIKGAIWISKFFKLLFITS